MSKLAVLLLLLCMIEYFAEGRVFKQKLQQRRLNAKQILEKRAKLTNDGKLFQVGLPFDYIFQFLYVGTPPVSFEISVETGYNHLWLMDPTYPSLTPINKAYDPNNSTTSTTYNLYDYGYSGVNSLEGWRFTDTINFMNKDLTQTFNTITNIQTVDGTKPEKPHLEFSGILGFGWDPSEVGKNSSKDSSPLIRLTDSLDIPRIVTLWQERQSFDDHNISISWMIFGNSLLDACVDDLIYFPITGYTPDTGLTFKVDGFKFGSYSKNGNWSGQLDTGASIIYVPSIISNRISRLINPTFNNDLYLYTTNCSQADTLDDWIFTINGKQFNLPASQYIIDISLGNGQCVVAFGYYDAFIADFIFGQPMLRQYCSVYDAENNQVGLSTAIPDSDAIPKAIATKQN